MATSGMPQDARPPGVLMLTVAAVARRLGVAPSTLRTWDRRYGLGPSAHTAGSHRRYSPTDVERLMIMCRLTMEGIQPGDAARLALDAPSAGDDWATPTWPVTMNRHTDSDRPGPARPLPPRSLPARPVAGHPGTGHPGTGEPSAPPQHHESDDDAPAGPATLVTGPRPAAGTPWPRSLIGIPTARHGVHDEDPELFAVPGRLGIGDGTSGTAPGGPTERGRPGLGGGRVVVALPTGSSRARGLARAAMALDTYEVNRLLHEAVTSLGVIETWDCLAVPVLRAIGERWRAHGDLVDVEHAFSESLLSAMRGVCAGLGRPRNPRPVVLGCAEGDYHTLPLHALAAALAEERVASRMLGVGMPAPALVNAVRRSGPAAVFLFAQLPVTDASVLEELPRMRPAPRILVGGCGWSSGQLPASVLRVESLTDSVGALLSCLHL